MIRHARRFFGPFPLPLTSAFVSALFLTSVACATPAPPRPPTSSIALALDSVNPDNIKTDLYFVAADDKQGRDTPSEGQRVVARYISARLERLGWTPAAPQGWFFTYPIEQRKLDETQTGITWSIDGTAHALAFGQDYFLPAFRDVRTNRVHGAVLFAGKGSSADFKHAELAGNWALCFDAGEDVTDVARRAREAHCIGLLLAPGPEYSGEPYAERYAAVLARQRRGEVAWPREHDADARNGDTQNKDIQKKDTADHHDHDHGPTEEPAANGVFASVLLTRAAVTSMLAAAKLSDTPPVGARITDLTETRVVPDHVDCEDVCGLWPGSDPTLSDETILISAHYDHVGVMNGEIYNGADDNGSGTCGLMAIAEALTKAGPLRRSVMLIWVSGEEKGLWGSQAWAEHPYLPGKRQPICDINIDMIGRNAPASLLVTPTKNLSRSYNGLVRMTEKLAPLEGFPKLSSADAYYERSDQCNFARLHIPVMFLFDDVHEDYHQPTDDADKIDYDKIRRVVRLVLRVVDGLQEDKPDLK